MMMSLGPMILGAVFCLLGTVVLAAVAFACFRYFVDTGRHGDGGASGRSPYGPDAERVGR